MNASEPAWFKSSYSSGGDGDCVEVALTWHKSTYSRGSGDDCVEVAPCPHQILVRDSKDRTGGPHLTLSPTAWAEFVAHAGR
ncbi:DUF397 domain-containing protein [Streptomyces griseoruber]|uniref:DUF397 domain-containing protein n=1 Tax=Streptomyces griseoruber TaxID=1943 RepID=UPI0037A7491C